jgi:hypothetical protein
VSIPDNASEFTVLTTLHTIDGLMSWASREEWRPALTNCLQRHTAGALAAAGIELPELAEVIGESFIQAIWGAAFEDLVGSVTPDGRNVADDYLRRRGWKETASTREYISGLRHAVISLYEVSGLVPGESMLLRDLVRPGDPIQVFEKSGSRGLRQWDRIATRVISIRGRAIISGTLMQFDHDTGEDVLASLRRVGTRLPDEVANLARQVGAPTKARDVEPVISPELLLAEAAPMFSNIWLDAVLKAAQGRNRPQLMNSDGEPLAFVTLHFPLLPGVTVAKVRLALGSISALRQETASFWNWLSDVKPKGRSRKAKAHSLTTTMEDGSIVLGNVEIKGRRISLMVNSQARASRGRAMLDAALAGLVRAPLAERADLDQMLAEQRGHSSPPSGLSPEQERGAVRQAMDDHYRSVIDERITMLGNRSPRAAVRTLTGRDKVVDWLKMLENHSAGLGQDDPMAGYDFGWMWRELGIEAFRR